MKTIKQTVYLYAWIFKNNVTGEETIEYEMSTTPGMDVAGWKLINQKEVEIEAIEYPDFDDLKARKVKAAQEKLAKAQAELEEITA